MRSGIGSPPVVHADVGLGQLREPDRQVDVGARVVDTPVAAITAKGVAVERDAAKLKPADEVFRLGDTYAEPALKSAAALAELRLDDNGRDQQGEQGQDEHHCSPPHEKPGHGSSLAVLLGWVIRSLAYRKGAANNRSMR